MGGVASNGLLKPKEREGSESMFGFDDSDLKRWFDKQRLLDLERKRVFYERFHGEMQITKSPLRDISFYSTSDDSSCGFNNLVGVNPPERQTTPRSGYCFVPKQHVIDACEAFNRSLVYLRGQPLAAFGNSSEERINYDQTAAQSTEQAFVFDRHPYNVLKDDSLNYLFEYLGYPIGLTHSMPWVTSGNTRENNNRLKQGNRKRKIDSYIIPSVTKIVTAEIAYNDDVEIFNFPNTFGLLNLKYKVAQRFGLQDNSIRLKYWDKENDLILIANDVDLMFAVKTTSINNRIFLICIPDGIISDTLNPNIRVFQPTFESVADNFSLLTDSSYSESLMATEKKRKIEWDTIPPVTEMMTANITFKNFRKMFRFLISSGFSDLENEVARSFNLKGKKLRLKYWDEDDDLIWIACNKDLMLAVVTTARNNIINLICFSD